MENPANFYPEQTSRVGKQVEVCFERLEEGGGTLGTIVRDDDLITIISVDGRFFLGSECFFRFLNDEDADA